MVDWEPSWAKMSCSLFTIGITELPRGEAEGKGEEEPCWGGATGGSSAIVGLDLAENWKVKR